MMRRRVKALLRRHQVLEQIARWTRRSLLPLANPVSILRCIAFYRDWLSFRKQGGRAYIKYWYPRLSDKTSITPHDPHYFFQGVWIVSKLKDRHVEHVDIGSDVKVMGMLTNFCPVTFVDIRPLRVGLNNWSCREGSVVDLPFKTESIPSLSCLHVIEHVGLGRYGDPVDPDGADKACRELKRVLAPGGDLYVAVPIGVERVCFNAHRVFSPGSFADQFSDLMMVDFSAVDDRGQFHAAVALDACERWNTGLGLFHFKKTSR